MASCVIDGIPLEGHAERSFAALLNNGGIASLHFTSGLMRREFERMIAAFTSGKPAELGAQLKAALGNNSAIRVNEIRFVAQDAAGVAEQLTARTLGESAEHLVPWLHDPEKLLQLIAAAEGEHHDPGASEFGEGGGYDRAAVTVRAAVMVRAAIWLVPVIPAAVQAMARPGVTADRVDSSLPRAKARAKASLDQAQVENLESVDRAAVVQV